MLAFYRLSCMDVGADSVKTVVETPLEPLLSTVMRWLSPPQASVKRVLPWTPMRNVGDCVLTQEF